MKRNTKEVILQGAIELFAVKGFNASTTAEIAQRAGVAEVTVFRHYKTKKDILMAVLEQFMETFGQEVILSPIVSILENGGEAPRKEILKLILKDRIALIEKNSDVLWIVLTEMKYHPEIQEKLTQYIGRSAMNLLDIAFTGNENNGIPLSCSLEAAVRAFLGTILSLILHHKVLNQILPLAKTVDESIEEAVEIFLHGITGR